MASVEDITVTIPSATKPRKWKDTTPTGPGDMLYKIDEIPPIFTTITLGFQHFFSMCMGTISITLFVVDQLCVQDEISVKADILGNVFFAMGLATFLQTTVGVRLPIVQGATASLWIPTVAMLKLPQFEQCPLYVNGSYQYTSDVMAEVYQGEIPWRVRLQTVAGTIICCGLFQALVGMSGLVTLFVRFVGPLVIMPTIVLIGLPLFRVATEVAETQWAIAWGTSFLIVLFTFYLSSYNVPFPWYSRPDGIHLVWIGVFRTCPVALGMGISWFICYILTITNVFPSDKHAPGYHARTDTQLQVLRSAHWFHPPYPGQFGFPRPLAAPLLAFFAGVVSSIIESVGDYSVTAKVSQAPSPPSHVISRGIFMEGIGGLLAGLLGAPIGTTSYSENTAAIGFTRVASRRVIQCTAIILILCGCFKKVTAFFVTIPKPVMGGVYITLFSMLVGIGLGPLQCVMLNSSRNMFIAGMSLFVGFMIPNWFIDKGRGVLNLGHPILTDAVTLLLSLPMFVGGMVGLVLDSTIPGSLEERGMKTWRPSDDEELSEEVLKQYDLNCVVWMCRKYPLLSRIPIFPRLPHRRQRRDSNETSAECETVM